MIKKIIIIFAAVALCGCDSYLDRRPLDNETDESYWRNEAALQTYSWTFYDYLSELSYGMEWKRGRYHAELLTDDYVPETFAEFTRTVPESAASWNTPYERIRETNLMLGRIDQVPGLSEAAADHWKGIAKFFRALYHFELVKTYGDVVWVEALVDFSNEQETQRPRDSRVRVVDNIVRDLKFAAEKCYEPAAAGKNVVNKYVAAALLSRVALYEASWERYHNVSGGHPEPLYRVAKEAAEMVIDSGLYEISDNYKRMYTSLDLSSCREVLLYKKYSLANVNGGKVTVAHSLYAFSNTSTPTWGLTKSAVENYAMSNGLPIHMGVYDDSTLDGVFADRDRRLGMTADPSILPVSVLPYIDGILSTTGYWTSKFVDYSMLAVGKAAPNWAGPNNDTDGPIFQYSEVLLNYAEACAELGTATQADLDKSVNILRLKHGGIPALTVAGDGCSVNGTAITADPKNPAPTILLQELRRERRSELMADGFRHDDLMRWALGERLDTKLYPDGYLGASKAAIDDYRSRADQEYAGSWIADASEQWLEKNFFAGGYKSQYNTSAVNNAACSKVDRVWSDKYYLEPIPSGQLTLDPLLGQNPMW